MPVCFAIAGGALLVLIAEILAGARIIPESIKDAGLILGGALMGLVAVSLNEIYRAEPERLKEEREREAERQRHQEERRLDFEQYRSLQAELRETKTRAASLQAKIELTGALDRDRVGDALLLGFYFHRRNERLASSRESIFRTAAERLKLLTGKVHEIKLEKSALHEVLELTYGPIVAESFDLGYVLSHLGEDGLPESRIEILSELERHLKSLRPNTRDGAVPDMPQEVTGLFRKLAGRVVSIVRRKA